MTRGFGDRLQAYTAAYTAARKFAATLAGKSLKLYRLEGKDVFFNGILDGFRDACELDGVPSFWCSVMVWNFDSNGWELEDDTEYVFGHPADMHVSYEL